MPDANVIENYQGNPNYAFGSSSLPALSTDVVLDSSPVIKAWEQYANNKLQLARDNQEALRRKQLLAQADLQKALDAGNYKIWDADKDNFLKQYNQFRELAIDVAKKGNWENINDPDYQKALKMQQDLEQFAQYSTQQAEHFKIGFDELTKNRDQYRGDTLSAYKDIGDPIKRASMDYQLDQKVGFELLPYAKALQERVVKDNHNVETYSDKYGFVHFRVPKGQQLNLEGAKKFAQSYYESDPDVQDFKQSPQEFIDYSMGLISTPEETIRNINYSPYDRAAASDKVKSQDSWIVDFGTDLYTSSSTAYTGTKNLNGIEFEFAPAQTNMYVQASTPMFKQADGSKLDLALVGAFLRDPNTGKIYATTQEEPDKLFPIQNYHTQVISPTLAQRYKSSPNYNFEQDVQNYAPTGDPNNILKIPRGKSQKQETNKNNKPIKTISLSEWKRTHNYGNMKDNEIIQFYKTHGYEIVE